MDEAREKARNWGVLLFPRRAPVFLDDFEAVHALENKKGEGKFIDIIRQAELLMIRRKFFMKMFCGLNTNSSS